MASKEQRAKIAALRGNGYNLEEISEKIGLSTSAISYQLAQMKEKAEEFIHSEDSSDIIELMTKNLSQYQNKYVGIPSGSKYVVNNEGIWLRLPGTGERLKVKNSERLKKMYLDFRGPGRVRLTDKKEILAYWNSEVPNEDLDPDEEGSTVESISNWCVIGNIEDIGGEFPSITELPNDPSLYKPKDIWKGPVDGMRYSSDGKTIFRSHPSSPRWLIERRSSGISDKIWSMFMSLTDYVGGRFYITEQGAFIANISAENLELDFTQVVQDMSSEQRQYLSGRISRTGKVPVFLGIHKGGIDLQRGPSIHDPLTDSQIKKLTSMFSLDGDNS